MKRQNVHEREHFSYIVKFQNPASRDYIGKFTVGLALTRLENLDNLQQIGKNISIQVKCYKGF